MPRRKTTTTNAVVDMRRLDDVLGPFWKIVPDSVLREEMEREAEKEFFEALSNNKNWRESIYFAEV